MKNYKNICFFCSLVPFQHFGAVGFGSIGFLVPSQQALPQPIDGAQGHLEKPSLARCKTNAPERQLERAKNTPRQRYGFGFRVVPPIVLQNRARCGLQPTPLMCILSICPIRFIPKQLLHVRCSSTGWLIASSLSVVSFRTVNHHDYG